MLQKKEMDQLDKGWTKIMIIWIAMLSSLVVYFVVCKMIEDQLTIIMAGSQLEVLKYALFGIAALTLLGAYLFRKFMMGKIARTVNGSAFQSDIHPAISKYIPVCVVVMAFSESVGIYGMVLFLISKDLVSLYQLMILSAIAMVVFRPKKEELIYIAEQMKSGDSA